MSKPLHFDGAVIKFSDAPAELKSAAPDADVYGYASVEVEDRDQDIVRVRGISLKHHKPERPVKLLAGHLRILSDGSSPIIGSITGFRQVTHPKGVPALAFGARFAPTKLGESYKALYASGNGPDFSIGFRPVRAEPLKGGGIDYIESELLEVSSVTVPANELSTVMRALAETYPGQADDAHAAAMFRTIVGRLDNLESALTAAIDAVESGESPAKAFTYATTTKDDHDDEGDEDGGKQQFTRQDLAQLAKALDAAAKRFR